MAVGSGRGVGTGVLVGSGVGLGAGVLVGSGVVVGGGCVGIGVLVTTREGDDSEPEGPQAMVNRQQACCDQQDGS